MKHRTLVLLVISTLCLPIAFAQSLTQQSEAPFKRQLTMLPYLRPEGCHPVEVKAVSMGSARPEVLTSLVTIKSFSEKPVTLLKVRWDMYKLDVGLKKRRAACDAAAEPAEILLSGTTPLIDVGRLLKGELYTISSHPQEMSSARRVSKVVLVDYPIIAWDELEPLSIDGTRRGLKDDYGGIVYVSEIHFEDGTRWEAKTK
ncbi:MAG TPA: hypothetical protein VEW46_06315 [Pyrinomonadaceae bacterium]|nr:hypothetical protein [Pyrinomonadaceae bacterium]